jgi:hypothetical protein
MTSLYVESWQDTSGTPFKECIQVVTAQWDNDPNQYYWINGAATAGQYFDTGLSVNITSKKANSIFHVIADAQGYYDTASTGSGFNISIYRNSTQVSGGTGDTWAGFANGMTQASSAWNRIRTAYDSPSVAAGTTLTYRVYLGRYSSNTSRVGFGWPGYISFNKLIVMELES